MTDMDKLNILKNQKGYNDVTANAYVEAAGLCTYCQKDQFLHPGAFWSAEIDHLLPVSKYPQLEWEKLNCVYSCFRCNKLKGTYDPLAEVSKAGIDVSNPLFVLQSARQEIIEIVRNHLKADLQRDNETYIFIKELLRRK